MAKVQKGNNGDLLVSSKVWDQLTPKERKLVDVYLTTGDEELALKSAGFVYSDRYRVFHEQVIVSAIFFELNHRIFRGAVIAQRVLEDIALRKDAALSTRIDAARALRAPYLESKLRSQGVDKPLTEHTIEELRALVETLENQRSKDAKPVISVEVTSVSRQSPDKPLDLLG